MNSISGNPPPSHSTPSVAPPTNIQPSRTAPQSTDRTMSAPSLSIDIPAPRSKFVIKHGEVVPEEEADSDAGSAVSSICQSPGWEQLTDTKKKKEKKEAKERKKEQEKANAKALAKAKAEAKHAEKRHKLTKVAPTSNKKPSRMSLLMNRSSSAPVIPQVLAPVVSHVPVMKAWEEEESDNDEARKKIPIESTPEIPAPWGTAHGTPVETTPTGPSPAQEMPPSRVSNDGFIGGLKLKLAEEAYVQDKIRRQSLTEERKAKIAQNQDSYFQFGLGESQVEQVHDSETLDTPSSAEMELVRTPQRWESIYEQAARMTRPESSIPDGDEAHHDRNGRKPRKKTYPPTSYFPIELDDSSSLQNSSINSNRRDTFGQRASDEWDGTGRRPSSAFSSERPTLNTRDTSLDRATSAERGTSAQGHTGGPKTRSEENSYPVIEDRIQAPESKPATSRGRRLSLTSIKNFARNSSADAASTIKHFGKTTQAESGAPVRIPANSRTRSGERSVISPVESNLHDRRSSSKNNVPTLQGIKHAAKAAFNRGATVTSPTELDSSPKVVHVNAQNPRLKNGSASSSATGSLKKAEKFFGQPISGEVGSPTDYYSLSSGKLSASSIQQSPGLVRDSRDRQPDGYHSRSTTDSSEEYSTHDESSSITTPMANSYYDNIPQIHDDDLVSDHPHGSKLSQKNSFTMTNAMPPKPQEQHPSVLNSQRKPDQQAPPVPTLPLSSESTPNPADLRRQSSLSRSVSTPELQQQQQQQQDLSFLPPLRHQALTKPNKEKKLKVKPSPLSQPEQSKSGSLVKSEPRSPVVSKSAETSPTSPISSQYLQNARASIPRPPPRGMPNQSGPDPIAKMFVVCCSCKYFHDMPSKIYECMSRSESVVEDKNLGVSGVVSTSVRCPWCGHGMTTACCAGYAAVVVLREKLH